MNIRRLVVLSVLAGLALVTAVAGPWTVRAQDAGAAALEATAMALNGVPASQCGDDGLTPPPGTDTCVSATPAALAGAASGFVVAQASTSAGVQPFVAVMGLGTDGAWGLWFASPAAYVPLTLPGEARVCAEGGLNVRAAPGTRAAVIGGLADGTVTTVDAFSLVAPGTWSASGERTMGSGWYRLAEGGWVSGAYLVVADGDCGAALGQ